MLSFLLQKLLFLQEVNLGHGAVVFSLTLDYLLNMW